jgi:CHASE2 domain-containing sensor protein
MRVLLVLSIFTFTACDIINFLPPEPQPLDSRIVLVNAAEWNREGLADLVNSISEFKPAVLAIDLLFIEEKDPKMDSVLERAFSNVEKLVFARSEDQRTNRRFSRYGTEGHTHFHINSESRVCESFDSQLVLQHQQINAFGIEVLKQYSRTNYERISRNQVIEIDFTGNILDYGSSRYGTRFRAFDKVDFDEGFIERSVLYEKIVILTYLGDYVGDNRYCIEPYRFITSLNDTFRKAFPDMWGGVVHANILSQLLDETGYH